MKKVEILEVYAKISPFIPMQQVKKTANLESK